MIAWRENAQMWCLVAFVIACNFAVICADVCINAPAGIPSCVYNPAKLSSGSCT